MLGVSPGTLRRWSDTGRIKAFTTPGGHRRFSRTALERLLPSDRSRRPAVAIGGMTTDRLARVYRRRTDATRSAIPWLAGLSESAISEFRARGRHLASTLIAYLDADSSETQRELLKTAAQEAAEYGRGAAASGLSLSQTVEGFLRFRAPFVSELATAARRRGFDGPEATELLQGVERAMDHLLVATMTGHSVALAARGRRKAIAID